MKTSLIILLFMTFTNIGFGQISSNEEAVESLKWIIENPQVETNSRFTKKVTDIFKWYAFNNPKVEMRVSGISEFLNSSKSYKFYQEILMIYSLSEIENQINSDVNKEESAFIAITNVLEYYDRLVKIDENYKNATLQKYASLSEEDMRKELKKLQ